MQAAQSGSADLPALIHIDDSLAGLALSTVLKRRYPDASWSEVKRWVTRRHIQVNGNLCLDAGRRMKAGDVVRRLAESLPKPIGATDIRIAYLDEHLVVIEKPAGITSVRHVAETDAPASRKQLQPTLDELMPRVLAGALNIPWPPKSARPRGNRSSGSKDHRPGLPSQSWVIPMRRLPPILRVYPVHRLDRDTSGLMVWARTPAVRDRLTGMFRRHAIRREYVAVCLGHIEPRTIESTLVRDRGDGIRGSLPPGGETSRPELARRAVTHIVAAEHLGDAPGFGDAPGYSLVRCRLETGRTHQIRIHLSEAGHPICGDPIYMQLPDGSRREDRSAAPRLALHSDRMAFRHPMTGEPVDLHMPVPMDLARWMRRLRHWEDPSR